MRLFVCLTDCPILRDLYTAVYTQAAPAGFLTVRLAVELTDCLAPRDVGTAFYMYFSLAAWLVF